VALTAALTTGAAVVGAVAAVPAAGAVAASNATLASATVQAQGLQPWPVLRQGPNSTWPKVTVRSLQYLLNAHGARLGVDGAFGPLTRNAVIAFQRAHYLAASGVADAATWLALIVTVRKGSTGPAVRAVQDQVNFRNQQERPHADSGRHLRTEDTGRRPGVPAGRRIRCPRLPRGRQSGPADLAGTGD